MWWIIILSIIFVNALCTGIITALVSKFDEDHKKERTQKEYEYEELMSILCAPLWIMALVYIVSPLALVGILGYNLINKKCGDK